MEIQEPLNPANRPRHPTLSPLRILRGASLLAMFLSTAFMALVCLAPWTAVVLRFFSVHHSRRATSFLFGAWLSLWPVLFEMINGTKMVFSGEYLPEKERALIFANHRTEVDWMYLWDLAARKGRLGNIRYVLKSSLMRLPVFGWAFHILEFIPVERKWEVDESKMLRILSSYKDPDDALWLVVFPEGTDYTESKCIKSQQYAAENGLPILRHVLLPKTKGFYACFETLRYSLDAVYDVTIGYKHGYPLFRDNILGVGPAEVHIHVKRFRVNEIPVLENDVAAWLTERFRAKDRLLSDFAALGHFPNQGTEGSLSAPKYLATSAVLISLTCAFIYLVVISSIWIKIYLLTSCGYFLFATYFNIRPSSIL